MRAASPIPPSAVSPQRGASLPSFPDFESPQLNASSQEALKDYIALLKPRVMSLSIFTAWCGLLVAPGSIHPFLALIAILCISAGAGASGCLNMWYERDIDRLMERTKNRPLAAGRIDPARALAFGIILASGSVLVLGVAVGWRCAALLALTIGIYVGLYTFYLKRSTPQNIVIGGIAGALPPVIGWSAACGDWGGASWTLFGVIFLWTPPHFWALSLNRYEEYKRSSLPMLPVVSGVPRTKQLIVMYSFLLYAGSFLPVVYGMGKFFYFWGALLLGALFCFFSLHLWNSPTPQQAERGGRLFRYSILYLFSLFLLLCMDQMMGQRIWP